MPIDAMDNNADQLPRSYVTGWPLHSICDCCKRALSRTQVWCSCGWEQRPPVVHVIGAANLRLCGNHPLSRPGEVRLVTEAGHGWVPLDRSEADPLPNCPDCIKRVFELSKAAAEHGEPFQGAEMIIGLVCTGRL